ncbi:hypothetical protein BDV34DRAFT_110491 [Aspergillus parasiticus]|uniref:Secreted protein n=1 Tax=Aspergillus parasiticus TaxID=5067 RepID=A0A5N6DIE0_ASPPA|nr:hypothetical protein BDV34DRAFT_110491 [Aspergillus parasiticus]
MWSRYFPHLYIHQALLVTLGFTSPEASTLSKDRMNIEQHTGPRTLSSYLRQECPVLRALLVWRRSLVFVGLAGSWCVQPCVV